MEPNYGAPLGASMLADYRGGHRQWQPVNGLAVAASVLVVLVVRKISMWQSAPRG